MINKQTPNKQIWLSSPLSGPKRFDYDVATNTWYDHRNKENQTLLQLLQKELSSILKTKINFE